MFPSTYCSLGPYPCFPSSGSASYSYPPFTFLNNPENNASANNTTPFLHDPLSVPYTHTTTLHAPIPETLTNWAVADCAAMLKQDLSGAHYGISNLLTKKPARKPAKKDRHSKIHTSQGLRDRRVRLSIEIARKFFDLQDMLGFDKASNTLAWLFNKSNKAIEELTRIKHSSSGVDDDHVHGFSSSSSEGEVVSKDLMDTILDLQQQQQQKQRVDSEERKLKRAQKEPACVRAKMKESREKARARARERTSGKVQDLEKKSPATENPQILHQLRPYEDTAISPRLVQPHPHLVGSELQRDDDFNVIEESIVIKRKLKQSSVSSSHHQNTVIPKEASFDNSDCHCHSFPMSPNWDANNAAATGRSNFCAIASMNLSAGLQIFGKSWEESNTSPHLY